MRKKVVCCLMILFPLLFAGGAIRGFASESVLAQGNWYRFRLNQTGIFRITYEQMVAAGIAVQGIDPSLIRLFGNGGAMLPEKNDEWRPTDLQEVHLQVIAANPSLFAPGDYVLFYGTAPNRWRTVIVPAFRRFEFDNHLYSRYTYYFLTIGSEPGQRIQPLSSETGNPMRFIDSYNDYAVFKPLLHNLAKSGREWFGEKISGGQQIELPPKVFPDLLLTAPVQFRSRFAIRASEPSQVAISLNGTEFLSWNTPGLSPNNMTSIFARSALITNSKLVTDTVLNFVIRYPNNNNTSSIWPEFVEANVRRKLIYRGGKLPFRDILSVGSNLLAQYVITASDTTGLRIWDVTNGVRPRNILYHFDEPQNQVWFRASTIQLREYIAFTYDTALEPEFDGVVPNQNLRGHESRDMIIVTPAKFADIAEAYGQMRQQQSGISYRVVLLHQIYNEFSSGSPDITAIRDYMKMLYDRAPTGEAPRFLLLFGDASYDPLDRLAENTNYVPSYQSQESLSMTSSFVTDDFFGLLDDGEGAGASGNIDVAIGRFPVRTVEDAQSIKDKVEHYLSNTPETQGGWKNLISIIAHDGDDNLHIAQAEELAGMIASMHPVLNVDKIYFDAFERVNVPGGYRYPDVTDAINRRIDEGVFLVNYIGHGGETGWGKSNVLGIPDIRAWNNIDRLPLFLTATCAFARFDDPAKISAGEHVFLNPSGGAIGLITTTRLAFSSSNHQFNESFTELVFSKNNGQHYTLGELLRFSKNDNNNNSFILNFVLLGDPSLTLAYPEKRVQTTHINNIAVSDVADTLLGMNRVTIRGIVTDVSGQKASGYSGLIYPVVFDKPETHRTRGNSDDSFPINFTVQRRILHKGIANVNNGDFEFSFMVPKDVNPRIEAGKISFYSKSDNIEAHGYFSNFNIGGFDPSAINDTEGPAIELYLNDKSFSDGSFVDPTPVMYARLRDNSGINFFGLGIGHDLILFLNEDTRFPLIMNNYFKPEFNTDTSGIIEFQFGELSQGTHTLRLRAWDMLNNVSEKTVSFVVAESRDLMAGKLANFPNPFSNTTQISFSHNHSGEDITATVIISDLSGRVVRSIGPVELHSPSSGINSIEWDGATDQGKQLRTGIYPYQVLLSNQAGYNYVLTGKMMILRQ